jgi:hypothetical protein
MTKAIHLSGEEISKIVASFLAKQGIQPDCYNLGTNVYPNSSFVAAGTTVATASIRLVLQIQKFDEKQAEGLADAIRELKIY